MIITILPCGGPVEENDETSLRYIIKELEKWKNMPSSPRGSCSIVEYYFS